MKFYQVVVFPKYLTLFYMFGIIFGLFHVQIYYHLKDNIWSIQVIKQTSDIKNIEGLYNLERFSIWRQQLTGHDNISVSYQTSIFENFYQGIEYYNAGHFDDAIFLLKKVPDTDIFFARMAMLAYLDKQTHTAIHLALLSWEIDDRLDMRKVPMYGMLCNFYLQNDTDNAAIYRKACVNRFREKSDVTGYLLWGRANLKSGNFAIATDALLKAIQISPDNPVPRHWLAIVYFEQGDINTARYWLENIVAEYPDYFYSRLLLSDIYRQQGMYNLATSVLIPLTRSSDPYFQAQAKWRLNLIDEALNVVP